MASEIAKEIEQAQQEIPGVSAGNLQEHDLQAIEDIRVAREQLLTEIRKTIVGQDQMIDILLISLFARGHGLFIGVPGLAKTLLISTLAQALNLKFGRIQFTPDLMPSDITGTEILEADQSTGKRFFKFIKGPIFCNILLADEINRTPPKTQAALLQAMQEYQVSAGGTTYPLTLPFLVFATQNPIESEGTYPLPEAQLDRFMFSIKIEYPTFEDEIEIVKRTTCPIEPFVTRVLSPEKILAYQDLVRRVPIADYVVRYAVRLARASRPLLPGANPFIRDYVNWGAGPRASQYLVLGGKARAILNGRYAVSCEDIRAMANFVLQHRIIVNFHAEAEQIDTTRIVKELLETVEE